MTVVFPFVPPLQPPVTKLPPELLSGSAPVVHHLSLSATDAEVAHVLFPASHFEILSVSPWATTTYTAPVGNTVQLNQFTVTDQFASIYPFYGAAEIQSNAYWEVTVVSPSTTTGTRIGIGPLGGDYTNPNPILQWTQDGGVSVNGGFENAGQTWGTWTSGNTLCFALDTVNGMVYGRVGASGNWNGSGTANPATNTGGLAIPVPLSVAAGIVVAGTLYEFNSVCTALFSPSSFTGVPPSGFNPVIGGSGGQSGALKNTAGIIRSATDAQAVGFVRLVSAFRFASVASAEVTARVVLVSIKRSAIDAQSAALAAMRVYNRMLSTVDAQALGKTVTIAIARAATSGQNAARILQVLIIRSAVDAQHVGAVVAVALHARLLGAGSSQVTGLQKLAALIRGAVNAQSAARQVAVSIIRSVAEAQTAAVRRGMAVIHAVAQAQVTARTVLVSIIRSTINTESVALALATTRVKILSAIDAQVAAVVANFQHAGVNYSQAAAAVQTQVAHLIKTVGWIRGAASPESTGFARMASEFRLLAVASTQFVNLQRLTNALRGTVETQATAHGAGVFRRLSAASSEAAAINAMRAFLRACSAASAQAVALVRLALHTRSPGVAAGSASSLRNLVGAIRSAIATQAASRGAVTIGLFLPADPAEVTALGVALSRGIALAVKQVQVVALATQHGVGLLVHQSVAALSASAAALARGLYRAFTAATTQKPSNVGFYFKFIPLSQRGRVVRLPEPQQFAALPPASRHVVLPDAQLLVALPPAVRRVVLPIEGDDDMSDYEISHAQPAYFSAFDPTDTDVFTFDWSVRGYPNDTIVFASVVSVPSGMNIIGPAFISGQAVSITVGPFAVVPPLPATFSLRCMAMFGSGRISNYSIPVQVMSL